MSAETADRPRVSKPLLVVLGVVVVAAVVFLVVLPLLSPDDESALAPLPVAPGVAPSEEASEDTEATPTEPVPSGDVDAVSARDPFQPLVTPTEAPTAPTDTTPPAPPADTAATAAAAGEQPGSTADAVAPAGGGEPAPAPGQPGPDATLDGSEVSLADVFTGGDGQPRILVAVDGVGHEAGVGGSIADRFPVTAIDGTCATLRSSTGDTTLCREPQAR